MKKSIKSIEQLQDSRILCDKNPPEFGYIIIAIVAVALLVAIIFAVKTPKIYTIQALGTVTDKDSNYVMCSYTGEIEDYDIYEGKIVSKGDVLFKVKSTDYDLQEKQILLNIDTYNNLIEKYELLALSIKENKNYFNIELEEDALFYSTYEKYKSQIEQSKISASTFKAYGYTDEQIESELIKNESKIIEIYYTALQTAENSKNEAMLQVSSLKSQLETVRSGQGAYEVKATASGIVHILQDYKNGMVVQTTSTVATISPENSSKIIETYVSTSDMARIAVGDEVKLVVDGLFQNVYGTISGEIVAIDSNVTVQQSQQGGSVKAFKVLVKMDTDYVVSTGGEKINIVNGMTCQIRIQYDKVTYMNYILEKLGFKTR